MLLDDQAENQRQAINRRSDQEKRQHAPVGIAFVHEEYSIISSLPDDESGRFFDHSAYTQMIIDVESGKIDIVIMKDMTRRGRDYFRAFPFFSYLLL